MTIERNTLPGRPSARLLREVRRTLYTYIRSRPQKDDPLWRQAWEWARMVGERRVDYVFSAKLRKQLRWPPANEIASQYLFLAMLEMKEMRALRLPLHAAEQMPDAIRQKVATVAAITAGKGKGKPFLASLEFTPPGPAARETTETVAFPSEVTP